MISKRDTVIYASLGIFGILGPILFPDYTLSIAYLWMMVLMASTWSRPAKHSRGNIIDGYEITGSRIYSPDYLR